jgi:hypothetical protein
MVENDKERPLAVFHHPGPVAPNGRAGSQVRPWQLLQAFREEGYDVVPVVGHGAERRQQIEAVYHALSSGRRISFVYSESRSIPTLLTEPYRLPRFPTHGFPVSTGHARGQGSGRFVLPRRLLAVRHVSDHAFVARSCHDDPALLVRLVVVPAGGRSLVSSVTGDGSAPANAMAYGALERPAAGYPFPGYRGIHRESSSCGTASVFVRWWGAAAELRFDTLARHGTWTSWRQADTLLPARGMGSRRATLRAIDQ